MLSLLTWRIIHRPLLEEEECERRLERRVKCLWASYLPSEGAYFCIRRMMVVTGEECCRCPYYEPGDF